MHAHSEVVQENTYYPFGMEIAALSYSRENSVLNNYRFQGDYSEKSDITGWNSFSLRNYDSQLGRWTTIDPYDQYPSSYIGMGNNPVSMVDPDGGLAFSWVGALAGAAIGGTSAYFASDGDLASTIAGVVGGALVGGFIGGAIESSLGDSYGNKLPGQFNNRTTKRFNWKPDWEHPTIPKKLDLPWPKVPEPELIEMGLKIVAEVPPPRQLPPLQRFILNVPFQLGTPNFANDGRANQQLQNVAQQFLADPRYSQVSGIFNTTYSNLRPEMVNMLQRRAKRVMNRLINFGVPRSAFPSQWNTPRANTGTINVVLQIQ